MTTSQTRPTNMSLLPSIPLSQEPAQEFSHEFSHEFTHEFIQSSATESTPKATRVSISVIVCAYTEQRWDDLVACITALEIQSVLADQIILVIDHNPTLFARAKGQIQGVTVIENREPRGLSGARNSGLEMASGDVVAFIDEDAVADEDWLFRLGLHYRNPAVMGVGGAIQPLWQSSRPAWFPAEFDWVIGCTYRGMPTQSAPVRNLIGCNMSLRRTVFAEVGGFRNGIGRVGTLPVGCEETELCIRARQRWPHAEFVYEPAALVQHRVPDTRATWAYFRSRCYAEGISKAQIAQYVGASDALASERSYTLRTLPRGVWRGMSDTLGGKADGFRRAFAIGLGLLCTVAGYVRGKSTKPIHNPDLALHEPTASNFKPAEIREIELDQPITALPVGNDELTYRRVLALVRLHGQALGMIELSLPPDGLEGDEVAAQIWHKFESAINAHLLADGLPQIDMLNATGLGQNGSARCQQAYHATLTDAPFVSVIVATRDRAASLSVTLDSLLAMDYPNFEILVVDNKPATAATAQLISDRYAQHAKIRYIREDEPGLAVAHNRGLREIDAPLVAFTDDDVRVDQQWLTRFVQAFSATDNVGCVTGMILPAELQTPAQGWIEQYGGFSKGFQRRIFDLNEHRPSNPLHPYTAGAFGSGASMAFSTAALRAIGGFDPALGAGSLAMGGDDLAAFFQVVTHGYRLVYEPSVILYHWHRRDYAGLRRQAYGYGVGLTAYLTKTIIDQPERVFDFMRRLPLGLAYVFSDKSPKNAKKQGDYPPELTTIERRGMLYGPVAYLRSRRHARRMRLEMVTSR